MSEEIKVEAQNCILTINAELEKVMHIKVTFKKHMRPRQGVVLLML